VVPRWYFNKITDKCVKFTYGGCEGNANNFKSESDCKAACSAKKQVCPRVCKIVCEYGNVKDKNGCDTCACNPRPSTAACPSNFIYSQETNLCYKMSAAHLNWIDSNILCKDSHPLSNLVVIRNVQQQIVLSEAINSLSQEDMKVCLNGGSYAQFFTSGQRKILDDCDSDFVWKPTPDYPETKVQNLIWRPANPSCGDQFNNMENCLDIVTEKNNTDAKMNDISCDFKLCSICQLII